VTSGAPNVQARLGIAERLLVGGILIPGYARIPSFLRFLRPALVRAIWAVTPSLRHALGRNAAVLLGNEPSRKEQRRFGLTVLEEIQRFTEELVQGAIRGSDVSGPRVVCDGNLESYFARRERGGGMVVATAHMGSFEASASILRDIEPIVHVLYARDPCKSLEAMRSRLRKRLGVIEHAVDDGISTWSELRDALMKDETVALPADRVQPGQLGFEIDLIGRKTRLPAGPFKLAMSTGSPLVPVFCSRDNNGIYHLSVDDPIEFDGEFTRDLAKHPGVRAYVAAFERILRIHPTQWMMVYEAWPKSSMKVAS
jgi:lauroyl/myristoyl acyltransferase